ncbi:MAG TPA: CHAP domain-containing protein, partial [Candidatus Saccharimonadales bacterium]|nr:CHAP domain-containing protein [Candidatus Saccharimonadales bacterium]
DLASYPGDYYDWGNCTWWVSIRRSQVSEPIPNNWGNAATWAYYAAQQGYTVDHTPSFGAIMQISGVDNGLGHVAFVESVDPDGTWHISEMNVLGLDVVDYKGMPASAAANYNFIHQEGG